MELENSCVDILINNETIMINMPLFEHEIKEETILYIKTRINTTYPKRYYGCIKQSNTKYSNSCLQ